MKIADLAEAIGVDAANISRLETGKQKQFTEQALSNIARSLGVDIADLFTSDFKSNTVCKNSISEDVAQVKDVFRIEMLDVSASAGNGLIQGGDVIDVIHAIEYRTDNAVSMFGGRPANHIKVINVRGTVCVQPLSQEISSSLMSVSISLMEMVSMYLVLMIKFMSNDCK